MKKSIIFILSTVLILGVFTACNGDVFADLINGGSEPGPTPVEILYIDADTTTLLGGKTYTIAGDVTNAHRLSIDGNAPVTILLPAGLTLNVQQGITVAAEQTLIIDDDGTKGTEIGKLIAGGAGTTPSGAAGIGGGFDGNGGTIVINGGTVTATGDYNGAGIGGGDGGVGGKVTINGGTVTTTGGESAAGIGGGNNGVGGTVTITGGTVTATGGEYAAGIGGGYNGAGGTISISGGTVTATGGEEAAGIGGGDEGVGGTVTITGGTVTAIGGNDNVAGIGKGYEAGSDGTLTIGDDVIMMVSTNNTDWSVYDGSTRTQYMKVPVPTVLTSSMTSWEGGKIYTLGDEDVTIASRITVTGSVGLILPEDKTLTASSGITVTDTNSLTINGNGSLIAGGTATPENAAGIGGGGINQAGGKITINGGSVTANGGYFAAGIGGGSQGSGGTVTIDGGTVTATGSGAAGIGAGKEGSSHGTLKIGTGYVLFGGTSSADTVLLGPVDAETEYPYICSHPKYMRASGVSELKDSDTAITLTSGTYTLDKEDNEVIVGGRITISGEVALLLPDGKTLNAQNGITVASGNTLVIDKYGSGATGTGILNATGPEESAGIGGVDENGKEVAGTIIINNGVVNATAGTGFGGAAGIGSAYGNGGTVTINGGEVTATGKNYGAGIGGGYNGKGGTVTINGGIVTATGGSGGEYIGAGAGIGGGAIGNGGVVIINGGTVTATGGDASSDGIGKGAGGSDSGILTKGSGVFVYVSTDNTVWSSYDGSTRTRYMKANK